MSTIYAIAYRVYMRNTSARYLLVSLAGVFWMSRNAPPKDVTNGLRDVKDVKQTASYAGYYFGKPIASC